MGYQDAFPCDFHDALGDLVKFGRRADHLLAYPGKFLYIWLDFSLRIDQADKGIYHLVSVKPMDSDLSDRLFIELTSGSFYIQKYR